MAKLIYLLETSAGNVRYHLTPGETHVLGRNPPDKGAVVVEDREKALSKRHAAVSNQAGKMILVDLGSSNGTFVDGKRLREGEEAALQPGMQAELGSSSVRLCLSSVAEEKERGPADGEAITTSRESLNQILQAKGEVKIGRHSSCDIVLPDQEVSRFHARVFTHKGEVFVEDLQSLKGTFVNDSRVKGKARLRSEDTLYVGLCAFRLHARTRDYSREVAAQAVGVEKRYLGSREAAMKRTSLTIRAGSMVAVMGPSGCGKSTLLKVLNGDGAPTRGRVYLFGLDLYNHFNLLKQSIGYVPQEDIVHRDLTVEKSLYYAAKLRLPDGIPDKVVMGRVFEVLESLGLGAKDLRESRVGRLSGGQRKRVSIAVEMLTSPRILFLDEPTSPLDPETIEDFLRCLRSICDAGTTVVMVTHKPEDLNAVDEVVFMGTSGYLSYAGARDDLLPYYGGTRINEVYALLSNPQTSRKFYEERNLRSRGETESSSSRPRAPKLQKAQPFNQWWWLVARYADLKVGNVRNLLMALLQPVFIAILVLLVFDSVYDEGPGGVKLGNQRLVFFMAITSIFLGVFSGAKEIVSESAVYRRERQFNLLLVPYLFSKLTVLTILSVVQNTLFLLLLHMRYGGDLGSFGPCLLFMVFLGFASILFGLMISAFVSSEEEVMTAMTLALLPQFVLAGVMQPLTSGVSMVLSYLTLGRWGAEGVSRILDSGAKDGTLEEPFMTALRGSLYSPENKNLIQASDSLGANFFALSLLSLFMGGLVLALLKRKDGKQG